MSPPMPLPSPLRPAPARRHRHPAGSPGRRADGHRQRGGHAEDTESRWASTAHPSACSACARQVAHALVTAEPDIAALLPCGASAHETPGQTRVLLQDPRVILAASGSQNPPVRGRWKAHARPAAGRDGPGRPGPLTWRASTSPSWAAALARSRPMRELRARGCRTPSPLSPAQRTALPARHHLDSPAACARASSSSFRWRHSLHGWACSTWPPRSPASRPVAAACRPRRAKWPTTRW